MRCKNTTNECRSCDVAMAKLGEMRCVVCTPSPLARREREKEREKEKLKEKERGGEKEEERVEGEEGEREKVEEGKEGEEKVKGGEGVGQAPVVRANCLLRWCSWCNVQVLFPSLSRTSTYPNIQIYFFFVHELRSHFLFLY